MRINATPVLIAVVTASVFAQAPAFDVASIRPNVSAPGENSIQANANGRLTATNATLRALILRAYGLHDSQLIGAPDWIGTERFDVNARTETPLPNGPEALMPLLRALLGDRFTLRVHTDTRELPAYVLTFAKRDRALGPQIRASAADCTRATALTAAEIRAQARDGWPPCGMAFMVSFVDANGAGLKTRIRRSAMSMKDFATSLQSAVDRPVIDRTGLTGLYDLEYSFGAPGSVGVTNLNQPLILVALEEQLGLKLEPQRTSVPVLVVDSVDKLIEN